MATRSAKSGGTVRKGGPNVAEASCNAFRTANNRPSTHHLVGERAVVIGWCVRLTLCKRKRGSQFAIGNGQGRETKDVAGRRVSVTHC